MTTENLESETLGWRGNPLTLLYETAIIVLLWTYTLLQLLKAKLQAMG